MAVADYTWRLLEPADEAGVLRLLGKSLGEGPVGGRQSSYWRWKHVTNVFGSSYARVAQDAAGELIGMRAFMQWSLEGETRPLRAVRAVDTATHPDYRRQGIFSSSFRREFDPKEAS